MKNKEDKEDSVFVKSVDATLEQLLLKDEAVLIEVVNNSKSGLILNTENTSSLAGTPTISWEIAEIGEAVKKYQKGDLVYDLTTMNTITYLEIGEKNYILTDFYNIKLAARK